MSDWGHHPFLDPGRPHGYDGPPPTPFANPYDFREEYEWANANEILRIQMDENLTEQSSIGESEADLEEDSKRDGDEAPTDVSEGQSLSAAARFLLLLN